MSTTYTLPGFCPPHALSDSPRDTPILLALSGGADSSALLRLLADYAERHGTPLHVAHVNHKLRGAESDADLAFCKAQAQALGLPFHSLTVDVAALAKNHRMGIEEQARAVRYDFFASLMATHKLPLLATAHNADDNAETVLFHLTRGSGLGGMCGIHPARPFSEGLVIRPLLQVSKIDILNFCRQNHIPFVTDATNTDLSYTRNRLRHKVLPELTQINGKALDNIARLCGTLRQDEEYLSQLAREEWRRNSHEGAIRCQTLASSHPAIAYRMAAILLTEAGGELTSTHLNTLLSLAARAKPHATADMGNGLCAVVEDGRLSLMPRPPKKPAIPYCHALHKGLNPIPEADAMLVLGEICEREDKTLKNIYKKATTTRISFDKIYGGAVARPRRPGDVILQGGMRKKLKKLMNEKSLSPTLRDRLPLIEGESGILWVPYVALCDHADRQEPLVSITLFHDSQT